MKVAVSVVARASSTVVYLAVQRVFEMVAKKALSLVVCSVDHSAVMSAVCLADPTADY